LRKKQSGRASVASLDRAAGSGSRRFSALLPTRVVVPSFVQELRGRDDRLDQAAERVVVGRQSVPYLGERWLVRQQQAAPQGIRQQLATQVLDKIILSLVTQVRTQAFQAIALGSLGEGRKGLDRAPAQVLLPAFADRAEPFKDQADGIETVVAGGARL